jgi:hypothetical protein
MVIKYRLGMPIIAEARHFPNCSSVMDQFGDHATTCKTRAGVIDKHNSIFSSVSEQMRKASMAHITEVTRPANLTKERPGDIFVPDFGTAMLILKFQ